jgi:hypothetical protein
MAGRSVESKIVAALQAHLVASLRNVDPAHGILEPCHVRLDPRDFEPARQPWQVDIVRNSVQPGDAEDTARDRHRLRIDISVYAPPGDGLADLFWRVCDLVSAAVWWPPGLVDVRRLDGSGDLAAAEPLLVAAESRIAAFELEFWTVQGDAFAV